jgi:hypothetical protein
VQVSNRYLDLAPVLGNLAWAASLVGLVQSDRADEAIGKSGSRWVVLARHAGDLGKLLNDAKRWKPLAGRPDVGVWTDDFSNALRVFLWKN